MPAPDAPGRYRVRLRGAMRYGWIEVAEAGAASLEWRASALPAETTVAPGARLRLVNDEAEPSMFVVETAAWLDLALRPGRLLSPRGRWNTPARRNR